MEKARVRKINEALAILDDAAQNGAEELSDLIGSDYQALKSSLKRIKPELTRGFQTLKETAVETFEKGKADAINFSKKTAKNVDNAVHASPWYFLGGAALVGAIAGFALGRQTRAEN